MFMEGGCLCDTVRYRLEGQPLRTTHCHCIHCRKSGASAFITWTVLKSADFRWLTGNPCSYSSRSDVTRTFCGNCGTQLTFEDAAEPGFICITSASLDNPERVTPQDYIWCDRLIPWVKLDDGLKQYPLVRTSK